jgi:hypothetical protein
VPPCQSKTASIADAPQEIRHISIVWQGGTQTNDADKGLTGFNLIVARTLRQVESSQSLIRIVGLSATLPNYRDVSDLDSSLTTRFAGDPDEVLFKWDRSERSIEEEEALIFFPTGPT